MARIVTISGSPSPCSRTKAGVKYIKNLPAAKDWQADSIEIRALPPEDLVHARFDSPAVQNTVRLLKQAEGVIIATPVYKASCAGLLKAYLDLLPRNILSGKAVWPIAAGGAPARLPVIDYALKPVLFALGAQKRAERRLSAGKPDPSVSGSDSAGTRGGRAPPGVA